MIETAMWIAWDFTELFIYLYIMVALFRCEIRRKKVVPLLILLLHVVMWSLPVWQRDNMSRLTCFTICIILSSFIVINEKILKTGALFFVAFALGGSIGLTVNWIINTLYFIQFQKTVQITDEISWNKFVMDGIVFLILLLINAVVKRIRKIKKMKMPIRAIILLGIMMIGYCFIIFYLVDSIQYVKDVKINVVAFCTILISMVVMTIYSIHYMNTYYSNLIYRQENEQQKRLLLMERQSLHSIEENYERIRGIRHDMNHTLGSLVILLEKNQYDEARDYLNKWRKEINLSKYEKITDVDVLDATLYYEKELALKKEIQLDIRSDVEKWEDVEPYKICTIIQNGLSNAIEAASEVDRKEEKQVSIKMVRNQNALRITIQNPSNIKAEEIQVGNSTKLEKGHGYGIRNILGVVKEYHGEMEYLQKGDDVQLEIVLFVEG